MKPYRSTRSQPPAPRGPAAAARGFTLIELMITVALAAILTALAAPSMTAMIRSNRIQTEASWLLNDLQFARSEAIRTGQPVSLCPTATGGTTSPTCITTNTWHSGWIVFRDATGSGTPDYTVSNPLLRQRAGLPNGDTAVASTAPSPNAITFNREGFTTGLGTSTVMMKFHTSDSNTKATRCISVDFGGRLNTLIYGASSSSSSTVTCS